MKKDAMTPLERAAALAAGGEVDRLPVNPNIANGVARIYGCKISEFNTDPKAQAEAQVAAYRKFGYDSVRIFTDLFPWAEAMGAEVVKPDDDTADLARPAVGDVKDIDRLVPADPYKGGRLAVQLEAMDRLVDRVGGEVPCSGSLAGPFTNAFFLYGVNEALRLFKKNPDAMRKLCRVSLETCKAYAAATIAKGLGVTISEPMSSCTVVSPATFREYSLPCLKELVDFIKGKGKVPVIHICGDTTEIWDDIADLGVGGFSVDNVVDLKKCCRAIGGRTKMLGNVDPSTVMYAGTPADVRRKTLECILAAYDSPKGYVVMSGCSLPVESPQENVAAMMDAVRDVGYPVKPGKVEGMLRELGAGD
ncbi:MAG: uroporphyrinogen decarboxylase family protein [Acidobacteriota bacterium]|jgi:uroporphyrinogen decarboxylase|nr:uroporphyrinogen decarboxylase family protein [Acidobacteriota bacterium]